MRFGQVVGSLVRQETAQRLSASTTRRPESSQTDTVVVPERHVPVRTKFLGARKSGDPSRWMQELTSFKDEECAENPLSIPNSATWRPGPASAIKPQSRRHRSTEGSTQLSLSGAAKFDAEMTARPLRASRLRSIDKCSSLNPRGTAAALEPQGLSAPRPSFGRVSGVSACGPVHRELGGLVLRTLIIPA